MPSATRKSAKAAKSAKPAKRAKPAGRPKPEDTPVERADQGKILLRAGWASLATMQERLGLSRASVFRFLRRMRKTELLEKQEIEGVTCWRLPRGSRDEPLRITTAQMVAFTFARKALGFLKGTGMDDDLEEVVALLSLALKTSDYEHSKNLARKFYDVNEAAHDYGDKIDVVNDVITALLHEQRVTLTRDGMPDVKVDPYTLVLYKKGLYLLACSRAYRRARVLIFGLDKVKDVTRHEDEHFEYPADFDPAKELRGPFGIIRGPRQKIIVRFEPEVAWNVKRKRWHETQTFRDLPDGRVEMTAEPEGCTEMVSWVLSYGAMAEVIEPPSFRAAVKEGLRGALERYAADDSISPLARFARSRDQEKGT